MTQWKEGDSASFSKTITDSDVVLYAGLSGDTNPVHLDAEYASKTRYGRRIAHGLLVAGLISAVLGEKIPGPGAIYAGQTLRFMRPVFLGDTITVTATISQYDRDRGRMTLQTVCRNQAGEEVITGEADVRYRPEPSVQPQATAASRSGSNGQIK
jgi:3-hydroxybutyryl-CoA dehydratase